MEPRELTSSRLHSTKQKMLREAGFCPSTGMQRGGKLMGSTVPVEKKKQPAGCLVVWFSVRLFPPLSIC